MDMEKHSFLDELSSKAKTRLQVSEEYGITVKTLNRWFEREYLNIPSGLIDPLHLRIIYMTFGTPKRIKTA
jgi:hypothetical protein